MNMRFPVIDPVATGKNIMRLRSERGLSVRDLQDYFGFEEPRAIYKWQRGQTLPSVDNLFALGAILQVPIDDILIPVRPHLNTITVERQAEACRSALLTGSFRYDRVSNAHQPFLLVAA
jgi:transcriptional regulator with XRE-family HTH domain